MSGFLNVLLGAGGDSAFTITAGTGSTSFGKGPTTYSFAGWTTFVVAGGSTINNMYPAVSTFGTSVPSSGTLKAANVRGITSRDTANGSNATQYYVYLDGDQSAKTFTSITIGGTTVATSSVTSTYDATNNITYVTFTPTTTAATLLTGTKTVVVT
jgi:hypothetical protein